MNGRVAGSLCAALLSTQALAGCSYPTQTPDACSGMARANFPAVQASHSLVAIVTSEGCLVAQLFDGEVPVTVANFEQYVREGFYTDLQWHYVERNYIIQTGSVLSNGQAKVPTHPVIPNESGRALAAGLHNDLYTLAMVYVSSPAAGTDYDSAATQFFVNIDHNEGGTENRRLDASNTTSNDGYCVFGSLVSGRSVAERIGNSTSAAPPLVISARILD